MKKSLCLIFLIINVFLFFTEISAQTPTEISENLERPKNIGKDQELRYQTFDVVWNAVNQYFPDPKFNGVDWQQIRREYYPKLQNIKTDTELYSLLQEMLNPLNSSHLAVIPPEMFDKIAELKFDTDYKNKAAKKSNGENSRFGIPIDLKIINSQIVITKVAEDSNAEKAGLKTGFIIEKIDGVSLEDVLKEIAKHPAYAKLYRSTLAANFKDLLKGETNAPVEISYLDEKNISQTKLISRQPLKGEMIRVTIGFPLEHLDFEAKSVNEKVGYISFNIFALPVLEKICNSLTELKDKESMIIDLRGNTGGSLGVMMEAVALFNEKATKIGTQISRDEKTVLYSTRFTKNYKGNLIILVDEQSHSSAEVFAIAMQENKRAIIVGETTAGEVQIANMVKLPTGAYMQMPVEMYISPNGNKAEGKGIKPDYPVALDRVSLLRQKDAQLNKAIEIADQLKKRIVEQPDSASEKTVKTDDSLKPQQSADLTNPAKPTSKLHDPKAIEIINKYLEIIGGRDALKNVNSYSAVGKFVIKSDLQHITGIYTLDRKFPNKVAESIEVPGVASFRTTFDGNKFYTDTPYESDNEEITKSAKSASLLWANINEMSDIEKNAQGVFLNKEEMLNGKQVTVISTLSGKDFVVYYFDKNTGLLAKRLTSYFAYDFDDYKKFDGIMFPTKISKSGSSFETIDVTISDVKINIEIPEDKFKVEEKCFTKAN